MDVVVDLLSPPPFPLIGQKEIGSPVSDRQTKRLGRKLRRMEGTERMTANIAVIITILIGPVESGGEWLKIANGQWGMES